MTTEEKQTYIRNVYLKACMKGLFKTQKDFAEALEVDRSGLSCAINGSERNLTDSLLNKVRRWAVDNGIEEPGPGDAVRKPAPSATAVTRDGVVVPVETLRMYENLTETVRILSELVARLGVPGTSLLADLAPFQKSPRIDR